MQPQILSIAGSDSSAGAGIQADMKTFIAHKVYGCTAITAITAQNTQNITAIHAVPADVVGAQIDSVMTDFNVPVWKTGMLYSDEIVTVVAQRARHYQPSLVLDPVLAASTGAKLAQESLISLLIQQLLPLAQVITPNAEEAARLCGRDINTPDALRSAAAELHAMGAKHVLITGGDNQPEGGEILDLYFDGQSYQELRSERIHSKNTHGTGCTLAAAIGVQLLLGHSVIEAIKLASNYVRRAIIAAQKQQLGHGIGPLHHSLEV